MDIEQLLSGVNPELALDYIDNLLMTTEDPERIEEIMRAHARIIEQMPTIKY